MRLQLVHFFPSRSLYLSKRVYKMKTSPINKQTNKNTGECKFAFHTLLKLHLPDKMSETEKVVHL